MEAANTATRLLLSKMPNLQCLDITLGFWRDFCPSAIDPHFLAHQSFRDMEEALYSGPLSGRVQYITFVVPNLTNRIGISPYWIASLREMFPRLNKDKLLTIRTSPGQCTVTVLTYGSELIYIQICCVARMPTFGLWKASYFLTQAKSLRLVLSMRSHFGMPGPTSLYTGSGGNPPLPLDNSPWPSHLPPCASPS